MRGLSKLLQRPLLAISLAVCLSQSTQALPSASENLQVGAASLPMWQRNDRTGATKGSVLLVLGAGNAGAWPHSLSTLADSLPDHGWHTLAIRADLAMPNLDELDKRVNAALDAIQAEAGRPIVVVAAAGLARKVALQSLKQGFSKQPSAFVFLNRGDLGSADDELKFHQQKLAVLELHNGSSATATLWRQRRNLAAEHKQTFYKQVKLPPVGPNWANTPDRLAKKVTGWLKRSYP